MIELALRILNLAVTDTLPPGRRPGLYQITTVHDFHNSKFKNTRWILREALKGVAEVLRVTYSPILSQKTVFIEPDSKTRRMFISTKKVVRDWKKPIEVLRLRKKKDLVNRLTGIGEQLPAEYGGQVDRELRHLGTTVLLDNEEAESRVREPFPTLFGR